LPSGILRRKEIFRRRRDFMGKRLELRGTSLAVFIFLGSALCVPGYSFAAQEKEGEPAVESKPAEVKLHDLELLDQDGRKVRFRSDVVGEKIAVIDSFFTTCGLICPIISAIYADLQDRLGDRLGKEVALVSISVDPNTDIPPRLKEFAGKWEAKPGWVFLTGQKQTVDRVLDGLGLYSADFTAHPAAFLVGDGKSGKWTRFYGFASPEELLGKIDELAAARGSSAR
jgi:protein SCO1/2